MVFLFCVVVGGEDEATKVDKEKREEFVEEGSNGCHKLKCL